MISEYTVPDNGTEINKEFDIIEFKIIGNFVYIGYILSSSAKRETLDENLLFKDEEALKKGNSQ